MNKRNKAIVAVGAAGLLGLGGFAALANADKGFGRMWGVGHGMGGPMQMMERYDADKDGKLSQAEIDQNRTSWHGEFDGDKNSSLSLDEFKALWLKARNEEMVREFQFFDRDGNAQVTLDEYKEPMANVVASRDRNGDGVLSREDRPQRGDGHGKHGKGKRHGMMEQEGAPQGDSPPAPPAEPVNP
jgi:hypothetical protein